MIVPDENARRSEPGQTRSGYGWTTLHSWIFLGIVAVGLLLIGAQNRYHYLSPFGLGKAYRIDKLFGGIQEFEPNKGWVSAQLVTGPPPHMAMNETSAVPARPPVQPPPAMNAPSAPAEQEAPSPAKANAPAYVEKDAQMPEVTPMPAVKPKPKELTQEERFKMFQQEFPEYGKEEFQLATDDLYPDWKKNVASNGTWNEFLNTYKDFIQWWTDNGSPPEPGLKLWKDFTADKKK